MKVASESLSNLIDNIGDDIYDRLGVSEYDEFDDSIQQWIEDHGIDEANDTVRVLCSLAAFNRFLKITLYDLYQPDYPELQPLESAQNIAPQLVRASAETGDRAFEANPLDRVVERVNEEIFFPLLNERSQLKETGNSTEEVGRIFEELVPQDARKKLGQFRTPVYIGKLMAKWAVQEGDCTVLDPGIGAGVLSACMYDAKQAAAGQARVEDMWGVDVSELAILMASVALKLANGEGSPNLRCADFKDAIPEGSTVRLDQRDLVKVPKVDAIVSNPPYTGSDDDDEFNQRVESRTGISFRTDIPIYPYFIAHSLEFVDNGGRLAFIIPSTILGTDYGSKLRELLLENCSIRGIILLEADKTVFEGADTNACILLLERYQGGAPESTVSFVRVDEWNGRDHLLDAVEGQIQGETDFGFVNHVSQKELDPEYKWREYVNPDSVDAIPGLKPFHEIATIKRGIATGKNDYFCLSQAEVDKHGLDDKYLSRLLRRTNRVSGFRIRENDWEEWRKNGKEVYLLYCYDEEGGSISEPDDQALDKYMEHGKDVGASESHLAQNRSDWHVVDQREIPTVLVTYMGKNGFRFIYNEADVRSLNNLHNVQLDRYSSKEVRALLAYLNSSVSNAIAKQSGRKYSRQLHKIEPGELKQIPVVDPHDLTNEEVTTLANCFDGVCDAAENGGKNLQKKLAGMDQTVVDVLSPSGSRLDLPCRDSS